MMLESTEFHLIHYKILQLSPQYSKIQGTLLITNCYQIQTFRTTMPCGQRYT